MIEVMMAGFILVVGSLSMISLIIGSIATNNRNKVDSTQTMLAGAILEQINSTIIGVGTSSLTDCAGNPWTIQTAPGGATVSGDDIDFSQDYDDVAAGYKMEYVVNVPCEEDGATQGTYDVRWKVELMPSDHTFLLTVGARLKDLDTGNASFSAPLTLRVMSGN